LAFVDVELHGAFVPHLQQERLARFLIWDIRALHDLEHLLRLLAQRTQDFIPLIEHFIFPVITKLDQIYKRRLFRSGDSGPPDRGGLRTRRFGGCLLSGCSQQAAKLVNLASQIDGVCLQDVHRMTPMSLIFEFSDPLVKGFQVVFQILDFTLNREKLCWNFTGLFVLRGRGQATWPVSLSCHRTPNPASRPDPPRRQCTTSCSTRCETIVAHSIRQTPALISANPARDQGIEAKVEDQVPFLLSQKVVEQLGYMMGIVRERA
jgi:hypothetical protein